MWEYIAALLVAITGLVSAIGAIVKYYDNKRETAKSKQLDNVKNEIINSMQDIKEVNQTQQEQLTKLEESVTNIEEDLKDVHEKLDVQQEQILKNEMNRLQTAIMDFAGMLRNNYDVNMNSFNYIYHAYDRYKELGGNSFVDSEMEFIKAKKKELEGLDNK